MRMRKFRWILLIVLGVLSCSDEPQVEPYDEGTVFNVLEDNIHSTRQNSTIKHTFSKMNYDNSNGYSKAFEYLRHLNVGHQRVTNGPITPETLNEVDVLFVNLMDKDKPRWAATELAAVDQFVTNGGGLVVIVDHTNVYKSSDVTQPLLDPYGWDLPPELACDYPPNTVKQHHWLNLTRLTQHPVTEGIQNIGMFAAGPILGPGSLARTSEDGFRDFWDESNPPSYWANFSQDEDEETESSSVLNAVEYGEGRVVVIGDQNTFGNAFGGWADNRKLWLNIFQWAAGADDIDPLRNEAPPVPVMHIDYRQNDEVKFYANGHTTFLYDFGRQDNFWTSLGLRAPDQTPSGLMLIEPDGFADDDDIASIQTVLDNGGPVFIVVDPSKITQTQLEMIRRHWPEFKLTVDGEEITVGETVPTFSAPFKAKGLELRAQPEFIDASQITIEGGDEILWLENEDGDRSSMLASNGVIHVIVQVQTIRYYQVLEALANYVTPRLPTSEDP